MIFSWSMTRCIGVQSPVAAIDDRRCNPSDHPYNFTKQVFNGEIHKAESTDDQGK